MNNEIHTTTQKEQSTESSKEHVIIIRCDDNANKDEIDELIVLLSHSSRSFTYENSSTTHGGDYYVNGGLQTIDFTLVYIQIKAVIFYNIDFIKDWIIQNCKSIDVQLDGKTIN